MDKKFKIEDVGNRVPFSVPENYFEQFAVQFEGQISIKPVSPLKLMRPWMYMAAMFLGVFFISRIAYTVYTENKFTDAEKYELYVMSQVDDVENIDLYYQSENDTQNEN